MVFRPRRLGTPVVLGVALATFAGLAVASHGFPVKHVSLNDGGIWVTDNNLGSVGRFARPIAQLDGSVEPRSESRSVNVWQDGSVVDFYDATGRQLYAVNVYQPGEYGAGQAISPVTDGIALGGSTLAVLSTDHDLRAVTLGADGGGSLSALSAATKPLAARLPADAAVAVGSDNTIFVAGGGELRSFAEGASRPAVSGVPLPGSDPMQVTTVGNVPVVADPANGKLYLPGGVGIVTIPGVSAPSDFELQQPSDASDVVLAATDQALYSVNLSDGQLTALSSGHVGSVVQPVQVAGCAYGAWDDDNTGSYARTSCGGPPATSVRQTFYFNDPDGAPSPVFRVNNGSVVLNDATDGKVFLVDTTVTGVEPQWQLNTIPGQSGNQSQTYKSQAKNSLVASPVTQGVRPGTTTVVHVLDTARGNPDATIVVSAVGRPDQSGVTVAVAPDAQTVLATVTSLSTDAHFQYTISDGQNHYSSSTVTLVPRSPGQNSPPALRAGYQPPTLKVAVGGSLVIPVIGEWRDPDGDPLYVEASSVQAAAGSAAVTAAGALSFTAPQTPTDQTVILNYGVSDGRVAKPTMASLKISVLGSSSAQFVAPVTEPDAALATVGATVTLQPLDIDLPGVDPTNHNARLTLAAPLPQVAGATVATDLNTGAVAFTAQHPGDFFLTYTAAYGAAPTAAGTIRVHVIPATGTPMPPVTTPAVAVLHGQQPAVVDVLANDYDPQGWILGVTAATTADPAVHVAVIDQRWLRVSADNPVPGMTATVDYTVSDGRESATGTVAVSAAAADSNADQITTTEAEVTVMASDSAAVPVLAGDSSSTGLPLSVDGAPPIANPPVAGLRLGLQGGDVRVIAPAAVSAEEETTVSYVVTDADGTTATGSIDVTIMPPPSKAHPDLAPDPQEVDARETAGDVAVIPIPVDGVDPDGDSVTVTGVTTAPTLGRIVAFGPDSISYQSYPGSLGTDTFSYQVTDPYGLAGTAQVRVAVLPPGPPQPPVAVNDVINAPPGASLHWNLLANDFIAAGDKAVIEPLSKTNAPVPSGVRLIGSYAYLPVPRSASDPPVEFTYGLTDGSTPSLAQVIVRAVAGAELPPIANDVIAPPPAAGAATVTVNVLKNDDDPVGSPSDLKVSWAPAGVAARGADLTIKLAAEPRQVPYQITASDGLTATAVVYVPGTLAPAIRLKPGALIALKQNGSVTVPLSSVLIDASGRPLKISAASQVTAVPAGDIAVSANQPTALQVHALGGYTGPGGVTVAVYDGATPQDPNGNSATLTIPVQVGSDTPVLRCTADPLPVVEGGAPQAWDIGQLCQLWSGTSVATAPTSYTVGWAKRTADVNVSAPGGTSLQLTAASAAAPGATGTLLVTPAGATAGATLNIAVIKAPLPTGSPVSVTVKAGQLVTVNCSQYVTSPLARPDIQVLGVGSHAGLTVTKSGSVVTIAAAHGTAGTIGLVATVTDVAGRADREISVPITVNVIGAGAAVGVPGAPGTPTATASSHTIVVSFGSAASNGAPIEYYTVYANGAGHQCAASPCTITGLANGTTYALYVTATNSVGQSAPSHQTNARPNAVPPQVTGLATTPNGGQVTLTWQPVANPVTGYQVEISPPPAGQSQITPVGLVTAKTFAGLTDGTAYTFTVMAVNASGDGPWSLGVTAIPFGKPATMDAPTAAGAAPVITVNWAPAQGNGSSVTGYTVYEYRSTAQAGPFTAAGSQTAAADATTASFTVGNDGSWYEYRVAAANQAGASAQSPPSTPPVQASAAPAAPTALTAKATGQSDTIQVTFTAGTPSSQASSIEYGNNAAAKSGTIAGPFTAGVTYTETLTNATDPAIVNGTPVAIYLAGCNNAGQCGAWGGPSNQVTPYGPPNAPQATATANGTAITFGWSGGGDNGLAVATYHVCIDAACTNYAAAGTKAVTYGYSQTHTVTVYVVDTAGQQSATATASATTAAAPAPPSIAISEGDTRPDCTTGMYQCGFIAITVTNFPANSDVNYSCSEGSTTYTGDQGMIPPDIPGPVVTITTDAAGSASFQTEDEFRFDPGDRLSCTSDGVNATYTDPVPALTATVSEGAVNPVQTGDCPDCWSYVHVAVSGFNNGDGLTVTCTTSNAEWGLAPGPVAAGTTGATTLTSELNSAQQDVAADGTGAASFDSDIEWMGGFVVAGSSLTCSVTSTYDSSMTVTGTYGG